MQPFKFSEVCTTLLLCTEEKCAQPFTYKVHLIIYTHFLGGFCVLFCSYQAISHCNMTLAHITNNNEILICKIMLNHILFFLLETQIRHYFIDVLSLFTLNIQVKKIQENPHRCYKIYKNYFIQINSIYE